MQKQHVQKKAYYDCWHSLMGFILGDLDNTIMAGITSSLLDLPRTWLLMPGQLLNIIVGLEIFFHDQLLILVHLDELYNKYYLCMFGKPGLGLVCYIHNNTAVCAPVTTAARRTP